MDEVEDGEILDGQEAQFSQISQSSEEEGGHKVRSGVEDNVKSFSSPRIQRRKKKKARQRYQSVNNVAVYEDDDEDEDVEYIQEARQRRLRQLELANRRSRWDLSNRRNKSLNRSNSSQPRRYLSDHGKQLDRSSLRRHNSYGFERSRREKRRHFSVEERSRRNRSYSSGSLSASHAAKNRTESVPVAPQIGADVPEQRTSKKRHSRHVSYDNSSPSGLLITSTSTSTHKKKSKKPTDQKNGPSSNSKEKIQETPTKVTKEISVKPQSPACNNKPVSPSPTTQVDADEDEVIVLPCEPKNVPLIDLVSDGEESNSSSKGELVLTSSDTRMDEGETATDSAHDSWGQKDEDPELVIEDSAEEAQSACRKDNCFIPTFQEISTEHEVETVTDNNEVPVNAVVYPVEPTQDESEELFELELRRVALEGLLHRVAEKSSVVPLSEKEVSKPTLQVDKLREVVKSVVAERKKGNNNRAYSEAIVVSSKHLSPVSSVTEAAKTSDTASLTKESQVQLVQAVSEPLATKTIQLLSPAIAIPADVPVSAVHEMEEDEENEEELELILLRQKLLMDMKKKEKTAVSRNAVTRDNASLPKRCAPETVPNKPSSPLTSPNTIPVSQQTPAQTAQIEPSVTFIQSSVASVNVIVSPKPSSSNLKRSVQVLDSTLALNMKSGFNSRFRKRKKVNRPNNDIYSIKRTIVDPYSVQRNALPRTPEDPYSTSRSIDDPYSLSRIIDDPYSIKRTVVNNLVQSPYKTPLKSDHRQVNRKSSSNKQERIVISVRPDDTSEDEEEISEGEPEALNNDSNSTSFSTTSNPVQLSESFHVSLDTFLKTVRESACKSQMNAGNSVYPPSSNQEVPRPPSSVAQMNLPENSDPISPKPIDDVHMLEEIRRSQAQWLEIESIATTDEDLSESEINKHEKDESRKDVTAMCIEENVNPGHDYAHKEANKEIISEPSSKPVDSVPSDASANREGVEKAKTSLDDTSINDLNQPAKLPLLKTDDGTPAISNAPVVLKPTPGIVRKAKARLKKIKRPENASKDAGPSPTPMPKPLDAAQLKQQEIQTREELKLRERLLRAALLRNEERLKLSSKENELIKLREKVNVLMGEALSKMNTHGEKKKRCVILAKKVDEIRQQLIIAEKALAKANEQTEDTRKEVFSTIDEAFKMRSVAAKLSLECRTLGIKVVGDKYVLPKTGAKELTEKMRSIYRNSTEGKDLDVSKGLKSASKEIYRAWQAEEPNSNKPDINDGETAEASNADKLVNFRVKGFVLRHDRKMSVAVSPKYHPYKSFFGSSRLCDGWMNESIVCKFLFSKVCSKPSCAFQHLD